MPNKRKIHLICAARPNFMKVAPLWQVLKDAAWCAPIIVHTGQHYDANMSDQFFIDLGLPDPHIFLGIGSGTHAEQTGKTMMAYEEVCLRQRPDLIVVVGDVNATLACALVGAKLLIPVAHLEAGLRSFDRTMPEEINRIVTDSISSLLLTPSADADENLLREGIAPERIKLVGNIMIDSLVLLKDAVQREKRPPELANLPDTYSLITLHRPSNVDDKEKLTRIVEALAEVSRETTLVFPVHPRTRKNLETFGLWRAFSAIENLVTTEPVGYLQFMKLLEHAAVVVTDSGGLQEETSFLGIPCLTLRENTERPITIELGTNRLVGIPALVGEWHGALRRGRTQMGCEIPMWDGKTAGRVVRALSEFFRCGCAEVRL